MVDHKEPVAKLEVAIALLIETMKCDMKIDENGHAYLKVPSRSMFDLGAQISDFLQNKPVIPMLQIGRRGKMMTKADKRALKIVELQEEIEQSKKIIGEFVWPPETTAEQRQAFVVRAAQFAGVSIPQWAARNQDERTKTVEVTEPFRASTEEYMRGAS